MAVSLSSPARVRMKPRGISPEALEILLELGEAAPAPGGRQVVFVETRRAQGTGSTCEAHSRARSPEAALRRHGCARDGGDGRSPLPAPGACGALRPRHDNPSRSARLSVRHFDLL